MSINRVSLHNQLPLETPFSVHVFPIFVCNFKCNYCLHSLSDEQLQKKKFKKQRMDFNLYQKGIDDLAGFPQKLKALIFAGHGEPLLHPHIAEMVAYAKQKNIAERIEIVTNGSLLTKELSDKLIEAGLDRLRISLQGITEEKYKEVADVKLDFVSFVENIKYFYENKTSTEVYIKIIDLALNGAQDEIAFKRIFSPIADEVAIEYAIPFVNEIDMSQLGELSDNCKQGNKCKSNICSMPFYMLVLYPNGDVVPCCSVDIPKIYGNIKEKSLVEIWNGQELKNFLCGQLEGYSEIDICKDCAVPSYGLQDGDYLDGYEEQLKKLYNSHK